MRPAKDALCLVVFMALVCYLIFSTIYGLFRGNPGRLLAPLDRHDKFCGYSAGYEDYPKLFLSNFTGDNVF